MSNKETMKFIRTDNEETAQKLRYEGYTELPQKSQGVFCFMNNGKKLNFDAEKYGCVYTNILCL